MKEIEEEIMIQYYNGSIFDSKADILCHQVNCQGAFGYGIAELGQPWEGCNATSFQMRKRISG